MGLLEEIQKQIVASLGHKTGAAPTDRRRGSAKPEFQGSLADLIAKGGLGGILKKFEQAGMGDIAGSWVGSGKISRRSRPGPRGFRRRRPG